MLNVSDLNFFDKFGKNLNFEQNSKGVWEGTIFFDEISEYLFDNQNIFILQKVGQLYKFPTLSPNESMEFSWENSELDSVFFLYDVEDDFNLNEKFINKVTTKVINYSDIYPNSLLSAIDLRVPLQINIAFSPNDEIKFERTLNIYYNTTSSREKIASIKLYGEGVEEDDRFKDWAQNFGIKFLKSDANLLKNYDIKEAIPDLKALNQLRKELLVSKEEIYPYIGTYKGLVNFINILGYKDILKVKEYWKNINPNSSYFNKLLMVDLSDYLDDGIIDTFDLVDRNKNLKKGKQFKKTEFLALVYQFTKATDNFDDDGIPLVEETTEFTVNEIFYKLNLLNDKLKNEFLPINVKIRDIIGEFIYFQKITISYWGDDNLIFDYRLNDFAEIKVFPGKDTNLVLRALDPLYKPIDSTGIDFGISRINDSAKNPFGVNQKYTKDDISKIELNIKEFYNQIKSQRFPNLRKKLTWETGDDPERVIGAPVILTLTTGNFTLNDLRGVKLEDLDEISPGIGPHWTLENINFRNFYEVNWKITKDSPNPYNFEYRGKVTDLFKLTHFLPYSGKYRITVELTDFYGNTSVYSRFILVQDDMRPEIIAFTRLEDKFNYSVSNLKNIQLKDFGASPLYYPKVNILNNEDSTIKIDLYKNLLEWQAFYKNRYGLGQNLYDVELFNNSTNSYIPYKDPLQNHPKKLNWGLGENDIPIKIKDFRNIELNSLYWLRLTDLVYLDDFKAGFYIQNPKPGETIQISLFSEYTIPYFNTLDELIDILNESDHPGIRLFNYEIINGRKEDNQFIIHAQAEYLSKEMYHILGLPGKFSPFSPSPSPSNSHNLSKVDKYTFFLPKKVFSNNTIDFLKNLSPVFDDETMFLFAKTSDVISGAVQDPDFWEDTKYWKFDGDSQIGYLPTTIDQNAFNINDIKIFEETFAIPENGIVFFVINNLDGKNEFIWTLTNYITGEEVIRAKSVPFFAWKFKDLGSFTLKVEVFDNRNTKYESTVQNFIRVLDKKEYIKETERKLNDRKLRLTKNLS